MMCVVRLDFATLTHAQLDVLWSRAGVCVEWSVIRLWYIVIRRRRKRRAFWCARPFDRRQISHQIQRRKFIFTERVLMGWHSRNKETRAVIQEYHSKNLFMMWLCRECLCALRITNRSLNIRKKVASPVLCTTGSKRKEQQQLSRNYRDRTLSSLCLLHHSIKCAARATQFHAICSVRFGSFYQTNKKKTHSSYRRKPWTRSPPNLSAGEQWITRSVRKTTNK